MKVIKGICNGIDKFNDILGRVFSVLVLGILGVILCEVVLRRIFNRPQIWTQDLTVMLFACYIILICAYGFQKKAFVAVDVIFAMLPQMAQHILHIITYLIFLVPFVVSMLPSELELFPAGLHHPRADLLRVGGAHLAGEAVPVYRSGSAGDSVCL